MYYLIHPNESYPTGLKLGVFFSNLANKNYSGNEQPPAIREILKSIDYGKLCSHLAVLIENKCNEKQEFITELQSYLSNVMACDSELTSYCSLFRCASPSEYLTTFLLYALFDDVNFPTYASEVALSRKNTQSGKTAPAIDLNNPHFQKLMNDARRTDRLQVICNIYTHSTLLCTDAGGLYFRQC